jgi:pSer/pThr/pTyr-binding forkhead associated (FHA) protein
MAAQVQFFDGQEHRVVLLGDAPVVVGGRTAEIFVPGATVTRRHARFFREGGRVWIEDLGGDGVWVNGARIDRCALANRDQVQVGALAIQFWED